MQDPCLAFCPYLEVSDSIEFADWELGPLEAFENRWADERFKAQAGRFLAKFVDDTGKGIKRPSILCRRGVPLDGSMPSVEEMAALELAIAFGFLDENPRRSSTSRFEGWKVITSDNAEVFFWPLNLDSGQVLVTTGAMLRSGSGGYGIRDPELVIRPPLDLCLVGWHRSAEPALLDAVYRTVLGSLRTPGSNVAADRLRVAVRWFVKAWWNTATVDYQDRIVFLKTAFEAITGESRSRESARTLRGMFERLPDTTLQNSEELIWSPAERAVHPWVSKGKKKEIRELLTDLELWFMNFADARNRIIHEGVGFDLEHKSENPAYDGNLVFTAEFLLRAAIKAALDGLGHPDLWRSPLSRSIRLGWAKVSTSPDATS